MLLTAGVLFLWSVWKGSHEHGVRVIELVLTGYMLLTLWRHLTNSMTFLFRRSVPLLHHRQVSLLDVLYSRVLLEFAGTTAALLVVLGALLLLGVVGPVEDWSKVIAGWLLMAVLATGVGSIILIATEKLETSEKFIQPVQYLLVPISGTFFMVSWFPSATVQDLLLLNPMVHSFELLRSGFFGPGVETHYSIEYLLVFGVILNFFGLCGIRQIRRDLQIV